MFIFPDLSNALRAMQASGIVISPWLAGLSGEGRLDATLYEAMSMRIREFALVQWTEQERVRILHDLPSPDRIPQIATHEIVASTAVYLAHERTGQLEVDESMANDAMERVAQFMAEQGFGTLLQLYMLITSWENQNALAHFGEIPERDYVLGNWHRPWVDYSLGEELMFAALLGNIQVVERNNHRYVQLTQEGKQALDRATAMLESSGYFQQRLQLLRISQFNLFDSYEQLADEIWPHVMDQRKDFLHWAGVQRGMSVLELGCANGVLTFDGGLADAVGPSGKVIAVDPSSGMLARARNRQRRLQVDWVEFVGGKAESLPFDTESFDM
ncbi:MAG: methyltransferase domain-containing protein, partial [Bacilli bacterium]